MTFEEIGTCYNCNNPLEKGYFFCRYCGKAVLPREEEE